MEWREILPTPDFEAFENMLLLWESVHGPVYSEERRFKAGGEVYPYTFRNTLLPARIHYPHFDRPAKKGLVWQQDFIHPGDFSNPQYRFLVNLTQRKVIQAWEYAS